MWKKSTNIGDYIEKIKDLLRLVRDISQKYLLGFKYTRVHEHIYQVLFTKKTKWHKHKIKVELECQTKSKPVLHKE